MFWMLVGKHKRHGLHGSVERAEGEGEKAGDEGRGFSLIYQQRVDEAPMEVMKEEQRQQNAVGSADVRQWNTGEKDTLARSMSRVDS